MTAMHGKVGTGDFTDLVFEMLSWSVEATVGVAEITDMADTVKTYSAGVIGWTASCECNLPETGAGIAAVGESATLTFDTAPTGLAYFGNAFCTGFSPSADKDGIARVTFTFQGSGALSES